MKRLLDRIPTPGPETQGRIAFWCLVLLGLQVVLLFVQSYLEATGQAP